MVVAELDRSRSALLDAVAASERRVMRAVVAVGVALALVVIATAGLVVGLAD